MTQFFRLFLFALTLNVLCCGVYAVSLRELMANDRNFHTDSHESHQAGPSRPPHGKEIVVDRTPSSSSMASVASTLSSTHSRGSGTKGSVSQSHVDRQDSIRASPSRLSSLHRGHLSTSSSSSSDGDYIDLYPSRPRSPTSPLGTTQPSTPQAHSTSISVNGEGSSRGHGGSGSSKSKATQTLRRAAGSVHKALKDLTKLPEHSDDSSVEDGRWPRRPRSHETSPIAHTPMQKPSVAGQSAVHSSRHSNEIVSVHEGDSAHSRTAGSQNGVQSAPIANVNQNGQQLHNGNHQSAHTIPSSNDDPHAKPLPEMSQAERRMKVAKAYYKASAVHAGHGLGRAALGVPVAVAGSVSSLGGAVHSLAKGKPFKAGDQLVDSISSKPLTGAGVALNGVAWQGFRSVRYACKGTANLIGAAKDACLIRAFRKHETPEMRTSRRQRNVEKVEEAVTRAGHSVDKANKTSKNWAKSLLSPQHLHKTFSAGNKKTDHH